MPYKVDWEGKGSVLTFSGLLTGHDLVDANDQVYEDDRFLSMEYQIVDFSHIEDLDMSSDDVKTLAHRDVIQTKRLDHTVKIAVVTDRVAIKGLARMWELTGDCEVWDTMIFKDLESARAWAMSP